MKNTLAATHTSVLPALHTLFRWPPTRLLSLFAANSGGSSNRDTGGTITVRRRRPSGQSTAAPHEITPAPGDTFTVLEQWLVQGTNSAAATTATQKGKTLTFSNQTLKWKELDAAAGDYVVGFIVQDLDGNDYEVHGKVTVK